MEFPEVHVGGWTEVDRCWDREIRVGGLHLRQEWADFQATPLLRVLCSHCGGRLRFTRRHPVGRACSLCNRGVPDFRTLVPFTINSASPVEVVELERHLLEECLTAEVDPLTATLLAQELITALRKEEPWLRRADRS